MAQSWVSFGAAVTGTAIGVAYLPVDGWVRGFLAMGLLFTVGSTLNLAKTVRDLHEGTKLTARVDEARVEKLLSEQHPLR